MRGVPKIDIRVRSTLDSMAPRRQLTRARSEHSLPGTRPYVTVSIRFVRVITAMTLASRPSLHKFPSFTKVPALIKLGYSWIFQTCCHCRQLPFWSGIYSNISKVPVALYPRDLTSEATRVILLIESVKCSMLEPFFKLGIVILTSKGCLKSLAIRHSLINGFVLALGGYFLIGITLKTNKRLGIISLRIKHRWHNK